VRNSSLGSLEKWIGIIGLMEDRRRTRRSQYVDLTGYGSMAQMKPRMFEKTAATA
jgi:hypothetical protein